MFNREKLEDLEKRVAQLEASKEMRLVEAPRLSAKPIEPMGCEVTKEVNYEKKGTFGWALQQLKKGMVVSRLKHIKKIPGYVFRLETELANNPVIMMRFDSKEIFWIPDMDDLLAEDWLLVDQYNVNNQFDEAVKTLILPDTSEKLLNFQEAFKLMRQDDLPVKRQCWNGYWKWDGDTILIFTADNRIVNIRETRFLANTIKEILADDWEIATEENCSVPIV
ncbi:MW1434 family type I TA system toxin [Eubacterium sp. 1001713B170207_170306_E7]|uniref:Thoeris anti-defense Tad2 family protein n=1 Tax=Eubacterium sp. 1001713B170207_170306_E7 TaxID=2787097 RepID=UPI0018983B72|nr:MW1434 family type I TA system toxin [Eubacterium sp. 1001713B170207_170306_E7]